MKPTKLTQSSDLFSVSGSASERPRRSLMGRSLIAWRRRCSCATGCNSCAICVGRRRILTKRSATPRPTKRSRGICRKQDRPPCTRRCQQPLSTFTERRQPDNEGRRLRLCLCRRRKTRRRQKSRSQLQKQLQQLRKRAKPQPLVRIRKRLRQTRQRMARWRAMWSPSRVLPSFAEACHYPSRKGKSFSSVFKTTWKCRPQFARP
mmetsp:Transcript_41449/g.96375  ORF Transcript_41449/g.96375 Transcript_41449/m.96375 type:complete len:205 (-) Transcript_41449:1197-1811(-)